MADQRYFTAVFECNITKFAGNPLKTETPFGVPVAVGIGDAFDKLAHIEEIEEAAEALLAAIRKHEQDDTD